jgi:hypothetical protein
MLLDRTHRTQIKGCRQFNPGGYTMIGALMRYDGIEHGLLPFSQRFHIFHAVYIFVTNVYSNTLKYKLFIYLAQ